MGAELCMVVLDIEEEVQMERVKSRHEGDENMMELAKVLFNTPGVAGAVLQTGLSLNESVSEGSHKKNLSFRHVQKRP